MCFECHDLKIPQMLGVCQLFLHVNGGSDADDSTEVHRSSKWRIPLSQSPCPKIVRSEKPVSHYEQCRVIVIADFYVMKQIEPLDQCHLSV